MIGIKLVKLTLKVVKLSHGGQDTKSELQHGRLKLNIRKIFLTTQ